MLHIGPLIFSFSSDVSEKTQQQFTAISFLTILMFNSFKYHNPSIQPRGVFSAFFRPACFFCVWFFQSSFFSMQFSLRSFSTTLHWSRYNSGERQPNGRLKPLSPVCLIAGRGGIMWIWGWSLLPHWQGTARTAVQNPAAPIKWLVNI